MRKNFEKHLFLISLGALVLTLMSVQGNEQYVPFNTHTYEYTDPESTLTFDQSTISLKSGNHYTITAAHKDVTIHLSHTTVIEGDDKTSLNFIVHNNHTITIIADQDLTFQGTGRDNPLLITFGGAGKVIFKIAGGKKINLGSPHNTRPVKAFLFMDDVEYATGKKSTLIFKRHYSEHDVTTHCHKNNTKDITIAINSQSILSYLSQQKDLCDAEDQGVIIFDPSNIKPSQDIPHPGTMILKINDGGFIIAGHWVKTSPSNNQKHAHDNHSFINDTCLYTQRFTWHDIKLDTAAGYKAIAQVKISSKDNCQGGLRIVNHNKQLCELLCDPFGHLKTRTDIHHHKGTFDGARYGFILGANALLDIADNTFIDYKGFSHNQCPDSIKSVTSSQHFQVPVNSVLKKRNPSAFIVDGNNNPDAQSAEIHIGNHSGLFFRSLFNSCYDIGSTDLIVLPTHRTTHESEYVFITEAPLSIHGKNENNKQKSKIELLSLQVAPSGGELFPGDNKKQFPKRTFNRQAGCAGDYEEEGEYLAYNRGAFLINDAVNLYNISVVHTNAHNNVFEKNDVLSEPTYIGGEKWILENNLKKKQHEKTCEHKATHKPGHFYQTCQLDNENQLDSEDIFSIDRPHIALFNSRINIHTDIAFTGVDIKIPNVIHDFNNNNNNNQSKMVFYQNGSHIDCGFGRNMVLGTHIGSTASNDYSIIDPNAHLDIIQTQEGDYAIPHHILSLENAPNSPTIIEQVKRKRAKQPGVNTIYLGFASNISIGSHTLNTDLNEFECATSPTLLINGDYFTISARGGSLCDPKTAHLTGQGGIFVDNHGHLTIDKKYRAVIDTMVTRSMSSHVHLPPKQVVFGSFFGIADWHLNTLDKKQQIVVDSDEHISHYTFNWLSTQYHTYCHPHSDHKNELHALSPSSHKKCNPFVVPSPHIRHRPHVKKEQVCGLATIKGTVDLFQIQGSRIGNEAQFTIDGGTIRELVFTPTNHSGEIPAAIIVLKNRGSLGVGPAFPEPESLFASTTLGINGITLIADGSGQVELNHDMIVDSRCAFIKGPHFKSGKDTLEITSREPRTIRVKKGGCLDFTSFDHRHDIVKFSGHIRLIMEPGSSVVMGGGTWQITKQVKVIMERSLAKKHLYHTVHKTIDNAINNPLNRSYSSFTATPFTTTPFTLTPDSTNHNYAPYTIDSREHTLKNNLENDPKNNNYNNYNNYNDRVIIGGSGTIQLIDNAQWFIGQDTSVGIETLETETEKTFYANDSLSNPLSDPLFNDQELNNQKQNPFRNKEFSLVNTLNKTNITLELLDSALFALGGHETSEGGSLQIGNTRNHYDHDITFKLLINGERALFFMGPQAFLGLNGGIVRRNIHEAPNNWLVDVLWDVSSIDIDIQKGFFSHAQIYAGDDPRASLLMIGQPNFFHEKQVTYTWTVPDDKVKKTHANIHGGGNIALISDTCEPLHPTVLEQDGVIARAHEQQLRKVYPSLQVGVLASRALMPKKSIHQTTSQTLFDAIKTTESTCDPSSRNAHLANAAIDPYTAHTATPQLRIAAIDRGTITRSTVTHLIDTYKGTTSDKLRRAAQIGAIAITIDSDVPAPAPVSTAIRIS